MSYVARRAAASGSLPYPILTTDTSIITATTTITTVVQVPIPELKHMKLIRPTMRLQYGHNHGKSFILFYKDKVRIAITTANLINIDYDRKTQVYTITIVVAILMMVL